MKKIGFSAIVVLLILALCSCVSTPKADTSTKITIEVPTPGGSLIAFGRHFKVSGSLAGNVPEDAIVRVALLDSTGTELRYAEADAKGIDLVDLSWYDGPVFEIVPGTTLEEIAYTAPELVIKDGKSPLDATIKAVYTDETFFALITTATAVENGLSYEDYFGLTDSEGNAYTALPEGDYTITASIATADGEVLSEDSKQISIGRSQGTVVHELTNADVNMRGGMGLLMGWAAQNGYTILNDLLPGMFGPFYQLSTIGMSYAAEYSEYVGNTIAVMLYGNQEISTSNSLEIAQYIQREHTTDQAKYYVFNVGEPIIQGQVAEIVELSAPVQILRIDQVTDEVQTGKYLTSEEQIIASDINASDGWEVEASKNFALMGVVQPYQLKDEELVDMEGIYSYCEYLNNIASVDYALVDAETGAVVESGNKSTGVFRNADDKPSVYEFYLVFDKSLVEAGKTYEMTLCAKDRNGEVIENRSTSFSFSAN